MFEQTEGLTVSLWAEKIPVLLELNEQFKKPSWIIRKMHCHGLLLSSFILPNTSFLIFMYSSSLLLCVLGALVSVDDCHYSFIFAGFPPREWWELSTDRCRNPWHLFLRLCL